MALSLALFNSPLNTGAGTTGQIAALGLASGRKLSFDLVNAHTLSFTLPGRHPTTALVQVGISDVMAWWDTQAGALQRFRVTSSQISITGSEVLVTFTCTSYRGLAEAWVFHDTDQRSWTATPQSQIMWEIFNGGQTKTRGNLGVVRGAIPATDPVRDRPSTTDAATSITTQYFAAGTTRLVGIQSLENVIGGAEWDINPDPSDLTKLTFDCYTQRGRTDPTLPLPLVVGSTVSSATRQADLSTYANVTRTLGTAQGTVTVPFVSWRPVTTDPAGTPQEGRWERTYSSAAITQAGVDEHGAANLARASNPYPMWSLTLSSQAWQGPSSLWLGDVTRLLCRVTSNEVSATPLLDVAETQRVLKLDIAADEAGGSVVTVAVGRPPLSYSLFRQQLERRLALLELARR